MDCRSRRDLGGLVAVRTVESLASSAMLPFVVLWAHRDAGLGGVAAGALFVAQALGEFAAGAVAGGLADRLGHRRVLLVSTAGMAAGYGLLSIASVPTVAIAFFLLAGVFESAFHPTVKAMVGDLVPDGELTRAFASLRVGANAGRVVGPLLGALAALAALPAIFAVSGALLAGAVVVELLLLPRDLPHATDDDEPEIPPGTLRALRADRGLAALVLGGGLLSISFTWWQADGLVLVRHQTALGTSAYAALFTIAAVVIVAGQLPVSRLVEQLPASHALLAGAVTQGVGLAVLIAAPAGYAVLVVAVVAMATGEMVYSPTVSTVVTRRARPDQRASYQAALSITEDIGTAIGPASGLALARAVSSVGVWACGAALSAVAGVTSASAARSRRAARRVESSDDRVLTAR
jgi:MFS family permease